MDMSTPLSSSRYSFLSKNDIKIVRYTFWQSILSLFHPTFSGLTPPLVYFTRFVCHITRCVPGGPIIGGPKAAKPCESQLKAVIRSKIKCKAAAATVKHAFLAQNIANYPLMKENETLQEVHVRVHCCSYGSFSFSLSELLYQFYPSPECIMWKGECLILKM